MSKQGKNKAITSLSARQRSNTARRKHQQQRSYQQQHELSNQYPTELLECEAAATTTRVMMEVLHPDAIWAGRHFLSEKECDNFIKYSERSGAYEHKFHRETRMRAHRDCYEHLHDDERMAQLLFQRMKDTGLIDVIEKTSDKWTPYNYRPIGCNPATKVYKYEPGMWFGRHIDVSDPMKSGQTEITVLIYLNECKGGATVFYPPGAGGKLKFKPEKGTILFHVHGDRCLDHEGELVQKGNKYVLRTDVVYDYY